MAGLGGDSPRSTQRSGAADGPEAVGPPTVGAGGAMPVGPMAAASGAMAAVANGIVAANGIVPVANGAAAGQGVDMAEECGPRPTGRDTLLAAAAMGAAMAGMATEFDAGR